MEIWETPEYNRFREMVLTNPELYIPISQLIEDLSSQGVLECIMCSENITALNVKMKQIIPEHRTPLTEKSAQEFFRNVVVSVVCEDIFEKYGKDATDDQIRSAMQEYVADIDWVELFAILLIEVQNVRDAFYFGYLRCPKVLNSIPEETQNELMSLMIRVFPLGDPLSKDRQDKGKYGQYFSNLTLLPSAFDAKFKEAAERHFAKILGNTVGNPHFKMDKIRLDTNYSKIMVKLVIKTLDWENKEISSATIEERLNEMQSNRPQYMMMIYVALLMTGEEALTPIIG